MRKRTQKDSILTLRILWSMSEFGGLYKHSDNPACTNNSVRVFIMLKLDTVHEKKKSMYRLYCGALSTSSACSVVTQGAF